MTNAEKMHLLEWMNKAIFTHTPEEMRAVVIPAHPAIVGARNGRTFKGALRAFDISLLIAGQIVQLRVIEQNPWKRDGAGNFKRHAILAQQGHKIMWVIVNGQFTGSIQDGVWIKSTYTPVQNAQPAQKYTGPQNLPDVPVGMDVPEYVVQEMGAEAEDGQDYAGETDPDADAEEMWNAFESMPRE